MASKNNPRNRDRQRLVVKCPDCGQPMQAVRVVPGGMRYKCAKCSKYYPISPGCYRRFPHEWIGTTSK